MSDEEVHAKLIVPDTGPLITLAAADSLDYLLYPGVPVDNLAMLDGGLRTPRDLGERAAIETIRHTLVLAKDERAVFITEDDRLLTGTYIVLGEDRDA